MKLRIHGRGRPIFHLLVCALVAGACAAAEASPALPHSYESRNALVQAVLVALEKGDRAALEQMRMTREEYERLIWPQLPESNDLTFEYAWSLNQHNSIAALDRALEQFTGVRLALEDVRFAEPAEEYTGFTLHLGARVIARRLRDGMLGELTVLDAMVEMGGRWKLLNFDE